MRRDVVPVSGAREMGGEEVRGWLEILNSSQFNMYMCMFWRQVLRALRPRCAPHLSRSTFRQKKHRLLANMKRLYQRSF